MKTKKNLTSERGGGLTAVPYAKSCSVYCISFIEKLDEGLRKQLLGKKPEVEFSRTSLASRIHFEVPGLGLEAS